MKMRKAAGPSPTLNEMNSSPQPRQRSANFTAPANRPGEPHWGQRPLIALASGSGSPEEPGAILAGVRRAPAAPDIDGDEQEQPHDIDEMPVPGGGLEPEMLLGSEV